MKLFRLLGLICVVIAVAALTGCFGATPLPEDEGDGGTGGTTASDGSVTVSLSGATEAEGETLLAYAYPAGEWIVDMPEYVVGAGYATITDGIAEFVLTDSIDAEWTPTGDDWIATGGANYDLYIYTHAGGDLPMDRVLDPWKKTVAVDGDTTVAVDFADFVAYAPTDGTLTVSISGAQEQAGNLLYFGVLTSPSDPDTDDPLAFGEAEVPLDGAVSIVAKDGAGADWTGPAGGDYDVYILIDTDGSGSGGGPTDGDLVYTVVPITYWQYGDKVMPTRYEDYETMVLPN